MKRLRNGIFGFLILFSVGLVGCGGAAGAPAPSPSPTPTPGSGSLALFGQDAPLDDLVKFEIVVSSVVLNPGNVSVLPQPTEIELTSLQLAPEMFRLAQNIPAGSYTGVTLTLANPEIKFRSSTGAVIEVMPPLQTSSVTVNVSFTVTADQLTGLVVDFDLRASVVTDASDNIIGVNPVLTASILNLAGQQGEFEDEVGRVVSVNATNSTFVFEPFSSCQQVTITIDTATVFEDFGKATPPLANEFASLQANQMVEVDADLRVDGTFLAEKVEFEDDAMQDELEGLIVAATRDAGGNVTQFQLVLFDVAPCTAALPASDIFTVNVPTDGSVRFRIDEDDLTVDTTLFDDPSDLEVGQKVDVDPMEALGTNPITAEKIKLEDQTIRGTVLSVGGASFELDPAAGLFPDQSILVETGVDTRFDNLPNGVGSLSAGQTVRVKGLLFRIGPAGLKIVAKRVDGTPDSEPPPPPPPPPPPSDTVLDDFERAALGSNWTVLNGDVAIINNSDLGMLSNTGNIGGAGILVWNATSFSVDQFSELVISLDAHPDILQQVFVRRRVSDSQRYGFHWQIGRADCDGGWVLKRDGGVSAPVLNCQLAPRPALGDTMRIEVQGSTLRGFHNGVLVITATDSVLTEPGQPGIAISVARVPQQDFPVSASESWRGGSLP